MHELSVASSLLDLVERHAGAHHARRIVRVSVRIGAQSGVEPELLRSAWDLVSERSAAAGAALALETVPVRWECPRCGDAPAPGTALRCARCDVPAALASGLELVLDRIELEVD
jgi:hydrogenase nickel incorporation protein HypA/HybF